MKTVRLGDIIEVNKNSITSKDNFDKIYYLDTGSITQNNIEGYQEFDFDSDKIPSRAKRKVKDKTIIYSTVRPNQKHYGFMENPNENIIVSTGFCTIDVKDKNYDPKFIYYLLTQEYVTNHLHIIATNSVSSYPAINSDDIENLKFKIPNLNTQKYIAKILSQLDQKIALNNQINAQLEQMAKTLYDYWFVQFDFPNQDGKPYKSSGGEMVYNEQLKREIPKDWEVKKLADSINLYTGKEDANFATENGKYPFFTCGEATLNCDDYIFDMEAILLAGNGSFAIKRYSGKFNAYQRTYVLEVKNKIFYPIIYFCLSNNIEKFINGSRGSIIKFITKGDIENIYIALPNNERTFSFEIIRTFFEKQRNLEKQNQQLIQLRDFLLPMLMNGQVGIDDD